MSRIGLRRCRHIPGGCRTSLLSIGGANDLVGASARRTRASKRVLTLDGVTALRPWGEAGVVDWVANNARPGRETRPMPVHRGVMARKSRWSKHQARAGRCDGWPARVSLIARGSTRAAFELRAAQFGWSSLRTRASLARGQHQIFDSTRTHHRSPASSQPGGAVE